MITRGFYRHWKGDVYFVEGVGQSHSNADENTPRAQVRWVLYQSALSCEPGDGITRMRPESEFEEWVIPALDGAVPDGFVPTAAEIAAGEAWPVRHLDAEWEAVPRFRRVTGPARLVL